MSSKKETKAKRECGFCHESGHNARSCEKRKAAEAAGQPAAAAASTALAVVEASPAGSAESPMPGAVHMPIEFEEAVKQVHVNGTTVRLSVREFDTGLANMTLRFQREATGAKDMAFDQEVAIKLYELLGWALQRQAVRRPTDPKALPVHRANGTPPKAEATR